MMEKLNNKFLTYGLFCISVLICVVKHGDANLLLTTDFDGRYKYVSFDESELHLHAIGVSLRKTFADKLGDRLTLFLLAETMHNFKKTMIDQGYVQYKGPLGKWNITLGRYRLPFGLLPDYSTNRLLITTVESETIGLSSDNGLQLSGTIKDFDYAISLSQGIGQKFKSIDKDKNGLVSFRLGYQGVDFEDFKVGISGLFGKIISDENNDSSVLNKKLLSIDLTKYSGRRVFRGEFSFGEENDEKLLGIFLGSDYALFPKTDINLGYSLVKLSEYKKIHFLNVGLTFSLFSGFQIRIAQKMPIKMEKGKNELLFQVYYIFSRIF
ncbi:MAG: hypothetical protein SNJ64_00670 [Endomicrobiia bacterium]